MNLEKLGYHSVTSAGGANSNNNNVNRRRKSSPASINSIQIQGSSLGYQPCSATCWSTTRRSGLERPRGKAPGTTSTLARGPSGA